MGGLELLRLLRSQGIAARQPPENQTAILVFGGSWEWHRALELLLNEDFASMQRRGISQIEA